MTNQERIDEFVIGLRTQLLEFIEQNDLLPHGHHYDLRLAVTRYREQVKVETKTYMNGPNWEPGKDIPTEEEWGAILKLPEFCKDSDLCDRYREFLLEMQKSPEGAYAHFRHYPIQINRILENAGSDFRVFTTKRDRRHDYMVRKIR